MGTNDRFPRNGPMALETFPLDGTPAEGAKSEFIMDAFFAMGTDEE